MAQHPTDDERRFWEENGCLFLEGAMAGGELTRLQHAFDRCAREEKAQWLEGIALGTRPAGYFDIENPLEKDDAFIDLIDHPSWYPYLMDFADDELVLLAPQVRTLPAQPVSYLRWHADVPHSYPLHMKVQVYVDDVPADGGAFGYVPGSHKPEAGECPNPRPLDTLPGLRRQGRRRRAVQLLRLAYLDGQQDRAGAEVDHPDLREVAREQGVRKRLREHRGQVHDLGPAQAVPPGAHERGCRRLTRRRARPLHKPAPQASPVKTAHRRVATIRSSPGSSVIGSTTTPRPVPRMEMHGSPFHSSATTADARSGSRST